MPITVSSTYSPMEAASSKNAWFVVTSRKVTMIFTQTPLPLFANSKMSCSSIQDNASARLMTMRNSSRNWPCNTRCVGLNRIAFSLRITILSWWLLFWIKNWPFTRINLKIYSYSDILLLILMIPKTISLGLRMNSTRFKLILVESKDSFASMITWNPILITMTLFRRKLSKRWKKSWKNKKKTKKKNQQKP